MKKFKTIGTIGRFKPFHNGHYAFLSALCENAEHVRIALGSPNKYDEQNPFTAKESKDMIDLALKQKFKNYSFIEIPDVGNDALWRGKFLSMFGTADAFATENDWVTNILKNDFHIIHPKEIVSHGKFLRLHATDIRKAMAKCEKWEKHVPIEVAKYIKENKLDERFRKEFGKEFYLENENWNETIK